ncbi:MAG: 1-acyl-sn-glycerol-3-phosphate acyltransferase [Gemmatimonadaceae bacterium]|nr:1-acyl-sn-glycerol-3-phosphate acyltransferase [Gemmatimonadaceae bacterium]
MIRSLFTLLTAFVVTVILAPMAMVAALLGVREGPGSIHDKAMRWWATAVDRAAGVKVVVHGAENMPNGAVYISNHVSWFDVFAIAEVLPRYTWVAKSELRRLPIFGRGAEAAGVIFIERDNRKSAFESYEGAAAEVSRGRNVVVCPEGTRGAEYALRPFKKGPFVLAVAAQAPVVPVLVYGAREVMRKGSFRIRPGTVHVHFLPPISSTGLTYDQRDVLVKAAWQSIAAALEQHYGIVSQLPRQHTAPPLGDPARM